MHVSTDSALPAATAISPLGPPVATSSFSEPSAREASLVDLPATVDPTELPAVMSAISKAPCGFRCTMTGSLRRISDAIGSFAAAESHNSRASRRRSASPQKSSAKSDLVYAKSVRLKISQSRAWVVASPHPCQKACFARLPEYIYEHQAAKSGSTPLLRRSTPRGGRSGVVWATDWRQGSIGLSS